MVEQSNPDRPQGTMSFINFQGQPLLLANIEEFYSNRDLDYMNFIQSAQNYSHLPDFEKMVIHAVSGDAAVAAQFIGTCDEEPFKDMVRIDEALAVAERAMIDFILSLSEGEAYDESYIAEIADDHYEEIEELEAKIASLIKDGADQKDIDRVKAIIASYKRQFNVLLQQLPRFPEVLKRNAYCAIGVLFEFEDNEGEEHFPELPELKVIAEETIIEELGSFAPFAVEFLNNPRFSSKMTRFEEAKKIAEETIIEKMCSRHQFAEDFLNKPNLSSKMTRYEEAKQIAEETIINRLRESFGYAEKFLLHSDFSSIMTRYEEAKQIAEETCKKNGLISS